MSVDQGFGPQPEPNCEPQNTVDEVERRRLSRQMYDSVAELVWAIDANLRELLSSGDPKTAALLLECESAIREIREELSGIKADKP
jgi:signal transduction histidine kinase